MSFDFHVVIPARFASTRLPEKPLLEIAGKAMVLHVVERALSSGAKSVTVATDHPKIFDVVQNAGFVAQMTREDHPSGTDRIAEVAEKYGWNDQEIIVNVQGDEPLIDPILIRQVAKQLHTSSAFMATAAHLIHDKAQMLNPNIVKLVLNHHNEAMYFSRAPIPYPRDAFAKQEDIPPDVDIYRHIGIYGYRAQFLATIKHLRPTQLEKTESLEQLRVLWHGHKITVAITSHAPATGVDTQEDLDWVRQYMLSK